MLVDVIWTMRRHGNPTWIRHDPFDGFSQLAAVCIYTIRVFILLLFSTILSVRSSCHFHFPVRCLLVLYLAHQFFAWPEKKNK